jgi:25S rRNA (cytosine2278-C5)-methyltransferase
VLEDVIKGSGLLSERKIPTLNMALVLVHDLVILGRIQAKGTIPDAVCRHKTRLRSELERIKIKKGVASVTDLAQSRDATAGIYS